MKGTMKKEVKTYVEYALCPCGGKLMYSGVSNGQPLVHEHKCNVCGNIEMIVNITYPALAYQEVEPDVTDNVQPDAEEAPKVIPFSDPPVAEEE